MADTTDDDLPESEPDFVGAWLDEIEIASTEEKEWRKAGDHAVKAYRGDEDSRVTSFNIFHANVETIVPALYNSVPVPDVRRRFGDPDPIAKAVADILERGLSLSCDAYDFDGLMGDAVKDMTTVGRGVSRVRYEAMFAEDQTVSYEQVGCEHVTWKSFRRGPARTWREVPWVAFEHFLTKDEVREKAADVADDVPYTYSPSATDEESNKKRSEPRFEKCARAWEIWDKRKRQVHFISPDYGKRRLWMTPDPLSLEQFFPVPRPLQAIRTTDSLIPITGLSIYESLVEELNDLTNRIRRLVKQCRVRGGYAGLSDDIKTIAEAGDGEIVPLTGAEMFVADGKNLNNAIIWWPLDQIVAALQQLVQQREMVKATIYEVTKIADIMRGSSDPNETLGAQQIKAQWGSLSVQRQQAEVARYARDLFRLKAELLANKVSMPNLMLMTGIQLPTQQVKQQTQLKLQMQAQQAAQAQQAQQMAPPQPGQPPAPQPAPQPPQAPPQPSPEDQKILASPTVEEVEAMLRQDVMRTYHIDIESDSTIRGDLSRSQQQMSMFISGLAQFVAAVGPLVKDGVMPPDIAIELLAAFARQFKLGKQAEDTLARWADKIRGMANQPQQQKPDPNMIKAQTEIAKSKMDLQTAQTKGQIDQQGMMMDAQAKQAEHQMDMQKLGAQVQADTVKAQNQMALRQAPTPWPSQQGLPQ
jgi:hypothetical protein